MNQICQSFLDRDLEKNFSRQMLPGPSSMSFLTCSSVCSYSLPETKKVEQLLIVCINRRSKCDDSFFELKNDKPFFQASRFRSFQ